MPPLPKILYRNTLFRSKIFHVEALDLQFSNGIKTQYERLVGNDKGAVLIVPMLDDQTVLLVREYAAGSERYELGFPKGKIEKDEDILYAADRELMEEVGYGSRNLSHLSTFTLAPGYMNHQTHIILARDLYPKKLNGDEPEDIEVVPWSLHNLNELLSLTNFSEARSIAALYMTRDFVSGLIS